MSRASSWQLKQRGRAETEEVVSTARASLQGSQGKVEKEFHRTLSPGPVRGSSPKWSPRSPPTETRSPPTETRSPPTETRSPLTESAKWSPRSTLTEALIESRKLHSASAEDLRAPISFDEISQSIKGMHLELARMNRTMRSSIHDEVEQSMKSFHLEESMKSMQVEVSRMIPGMSRSIRSVVHCELERFFKSSVEPETAWKPASSFSGYTTSSANSDTRATPLFHEARNVFERDQKRIDEHSGNQKSNTGVARTSGGPAKVAKAQQVHVESCDLSQPLLAGEESKCRQISQESEERSKYPSEATSSHMLPAPSGGSKRRRSMSADEWDGRGQKDSIKSLLQQAHKEATYNVEDFYQTHGIWQALARQDSWFSHLSLALVALNVIWIGIDEDLNRADVLCNAPPLSQFVNNAFCVFFTFELLAHLLAFVNRWNAFADGAFVFDLVLVGFMIWETWIESLLYLCLDIQPSANSSCGTQLFRFFRLVRLTRIPRIVRMMGAVPELMILMKGMGIAMRSVMVILLFLIFTIFIFGILFTELLRNEEPFKESFGTVVVSMNTLLIQVLCGCDPDFMNALLKMGITYYALYLIFLFAAILTLLNMLVGVLCDVVSNVAQDEKANILEENLEYEIGLITASIDEDGSGTICKTEFEALMSNKSTLKSLDGIGVDVVAFGGLSNFLLPDDDSELTVSEFCHLCAQFRGSRVVTVKDLVDTHKFITMELDALANEVRQLFHKADVANGQHGNNGLHSEWGS